MRITRLICDREFYSVYTFLLSVPFLSRGQFLSQFQYYPLYLYLIIFLEAQAKAENKNYKYINYRRGATASNRKNKLSVNQDLNNMW